MHTRCTVQYSIINPTSVRERALDLVDDRHADRRARLARAVPARLAGAHVDALLSDGARDLIQLDRCEHSATSTSISLPLPLGRTQYVLRGWARERVEEYCAVGILNTVHYRRRTRARNGTSLRVEVDAGPDADEHVARVAMAARAVGLRVREGLHLAHELRRELLRSSHAERRGRHEHCHEADRTHSETGDERRGEVTRGEMS